MRSYYCCDCKQLLEEKEMGVEFVRFTDDRKPIYRKLFAFFCGACHKWRQVSDEGKVDEGWTLSKIKGKERK